MHCNIMICAHNNDMVHLDFTIDIPSIITYCDVIMEKSNVYYLIPTKYSILNGISTTDLVMKIPFKTGQSMT